MPAAANGANEAAVQLFLEKKIGFMDIPRLVQAAADSQPAVQAAKVEDVLEADRMARSRVLELAGSL